MISVKEYLEIYKKYPNPKSDNKYHTHYEGEEEDYNKIIEYNKELCKEYPFLKPKNRWTGLEIEEYDYSYTELDSMPDGWRIAFGMAMMEEIKQALLHAQELNPTGGYKESWVTNKYNSDKILSYLEGFMITQIKEKYGSLRFYCGSTTQEVFDIIHKYERLSEKICINCGKPAEYESTGWISPYCSDCAYKIFDEYHREDVKFEDNFIPLEKSI